MLLLDCVGSRRNPATFKLMGLDLSIQAEQNGTIKFWNLVATTCQDLGNVFQRAIRRECGKRAKN